MTEDVDERSRLRRAWDGTWGRLWRLFLDRVVHKILRINDSPHALAMGVTVGMFVAMTPTVGVQMPIAFVAASLLRGNRVAAIAMCWISNPVTMVPLYYGYYRMGRLFYPAREVSYDDVAAIVRPREGDSSFDALWALIEQLGWPLWIGGFIAAVVLTIPTYPLTRSWLERRERERARRLEDESAALADPEGTRVVHPEEREGAGR